MKDKESSVHKIINCFKNGGKLLIIGNGGSAEMASHLAAEFINKMEHERKPLPAIALTDVANITSIANDSDFKYIFSRQVEALGRPGDILIIFTTSPIALSPDAHKGSHGANIREVVIKADCLGIKYIVSPRIGSTTAEIQENQLHWLHDIARKVELAFI